MLNKVLWIRQDKQTGENDVIRNYGHLRELLKDYYPNLDLAMQNATEEKPLQTNFAYYWPKIS